MSADGFVDQEYVFNPKNEYFIETGTELRDGMVVLVANDNLRIERKRFDLDDRTRLRAKIENRWCKISRLDQSDKYYVRFTAVYGDGMVVERELARNMGWYVKL